MRQRKDRVTEDPQHPTWRGPADEFADGLETYRELIELAPAILWRVDVNTLLFTFVSAFAETLLGYPRHLWIEQPSFFEEHIYPEDRDWVVAHRMRAANNGGNYDIEYRLISRDDRALWVRELARVLPPEDGGELVGVIVDLSQKRAAPQALGEAKLWLRQIIDTIPVQIWSGPADGTLDFCNARWRNELGITQEELQGDGWQRMLHPADRDRVLQAWHESVTNGTPYEQQERHFLADGQTRWFLCRGVPLRDEEGNITRWFGSNTDIEDQKRAEQAVQHTEKHLREVIDTIPQLIWSSSADGSAQFCNARLLNELGLSQEDTQTDGWHRVVHPDDRDRVINAWRASVANGTPFELEARYRTANGQFRWFLGRAVPLRDERGKIVKWFGTSTDIEDRKQAEEALRKSEQRWRSVFENTQVGVALLDSSLHFIDTNEAYQKMVGYNAEELRSKTSLEMTYEADQPPCQLLVDEMLAGQRDHFDTEKRYLRKNGDIIWVRLNGSSFGSGQDRIWVAMVEDITERKQTQDALRKSEQRWRSVFENTQLGVALLDASLHIIGANEAYQKMVGYSADELQSMTAMDVTYEDDRPSFRLVVDEMISGKRDHFDVEKRNLQKSGKSIWVRVNGSSFGSGEGRLWVAMVTDISERKRLSDQLQRERDRLRLVLDLGDRFVSKLDVRELFDAVLDGVRRIAGWQWASILLPVPTSDELTVYLSSRGSYLPEGSSVPIADSLQGKVYRSGKPIVFRIEDLPELCRVYRGNQRMQDVARSEQIQAGCSLPLIHEGQIIGVLVLMTRVANDATDDNLNFLQELAKPIALSLRNALRYEQVNESRDKLVSANHRIEDQIRAEFSFETIVGVSQAIRNVLQHVETVGPTDSTVLILGETGTGKELVARAIHDRSPRSEQSFIKVDCSAIPGTLMESELFGYEKGAFTGAAALRLGRFEIADKGTLFLDEVGDIPLELQPKLLRVLQDQAFERLGSNRTRHLDVRIVAATNRDLEKMVEEGDFRSDLYYRLKVFPITIAPVRQRPEDIPPLVRHYVAKYAQRMKKQINEIPSNAMEVFIRYPWPGNVRELQHFIERSVVLSPDSVLRAPLRELEQVIRNRPVAAKASPASRTMEEIERESILEALRHSNWVVGGPHGAAKRLGMKRTTLASRMERLGISRKR